jgi:hypothetical protein
MDPLAFAIGVPGVIALGVGARLGFLAAGHLGRKKSLSPSLGSPQSSNLPLRSLSSIAIDGDMIRHEDGAYSAMWSLEFPPGHFQEYSDTEEACERFARLLAMKLPPGSIIQFRLKVEYDKGVLIEKFLEARPKTNIYGPSRVLQDSDIDHLALLAEKNQFRRQALYLWVRLPIKVDDQGVSASNLFSALSHGVSGFVHEVRSARVVQRSVQSEMEAREKADRFFQNVKALIPFTHSRLTGRDLFNVLYLSLNRSRKTIPDPGPMNEPLDLRPFLLRDEVAFGKDHVIVGNVPLARVTMNTPPNPSITPDTFLRLTIDPRLHFPHTLVVEYVTLDQRRVIRKYDGRIRSIHRFARRITDKIEYSPEAKASLADLEMVREQTTQPGNAVVQARVYVLVEGPVIEGNETRLALEELTSRCDDVLSSFHSIPKVDAHREQEGSASFLLPLSMIGQANQKPTHSEFEELADSLACLIPLKDAWKGHRKPHFLCSTVTNRLFGINLFSTENTSSPLGLVIAGPGGGKSVLMAQLANSVLSSVPYARVKAIDFGESFGALAEVCGGRHIRFTLGEVRAINIWAYPGMTAGLAPDEQQLALVVNDLKYLARVPDDDVDAERVFQICVKAVYENELPRIKRNPDVYAEPTLSNLLAVMRSYYFESPKMAELCQVLRTRLLPYENHPWLDAVTHSSYRQDSVFDVFELDSLMNFPTDIRDSIAYRVSAWVLRSIQDFDADGQRKPLLTIFDEMHKLGNFPRVFKALETGARQGRTANTVTLLGTHSYRDLSNIAGLVSTAGTVIIGKQNGDFQDLAAQAALTPEAYEAVLQISNVPGERAQYVYATGKGPEKRIEWIQSNVSPMGLWTYTTAPNERNARTLVRRLRPEWSMFKVVEWLSLRHPRGLDFNGLTELSPEDLHVLRAGGF